MPGYTDYLSLYRLTLPQPLYSPNEHCAPVSMLIVPSQLNISTPVRVGALVYQARYCPTITTAFRGNVITPHLVIPSLCLEYAPEEVYTIAV